MQMTRRPSKYCYRDTNGYISDISTLQVPLVILRNVRDVLVRNARPVLLPGLSEFLLQFAILYARTPKQGEPSVYGGDPPRPHQPQRTRRGDVADGYEAVWAKAHEVCAEEHHDAPRIRWMACVRVRAVGDEFVVVLDRDFEREHLAHGAIAPDAEKPCADHQSEAGEEAWRKRG